MNLPPTDAAAPSTTFSGRVDRHLAEPPSAASARSPTSWWAMVVSAGLGGGLSYVGISMAMDVELARGLVGLPPMQAEYERFVVEVGPLGVQPDCCGWGG